MLVIIFGSTLLSGPLGDASPQGHQQGSTSGMDMGDNGEMRGMGPSMVAMDARMYITPLRPKQPGDEERGKAVVAALKATMLWNREFFLLNRFSLS